MITKNNFNIRILSICLIIGMVMVECTSTQHPTSRLAENDFSLAIHQTRIEPEQLYVITKDNVEVFKVSYRSKGGGQSRFQRVYSRSLSTDESAQVRTMSQHLYALGDYYEAPTLGGTLWTIQVHDGSVYKEIILENAHTSSTADLFRFVNTLLPTGVSTLLLR